MENATIKPDKEQPDSIPSLVTQDDLERELGKWVITAIQKDKIIQLLTTQIGKQNAAITAQKKEMDNVSAIERSNRQLDEKNRKLAESIKDIKKERDEALADKAIAVADQAKTEEALLACKEENDRLQTLCDQLQAKTEKGKKPRKTTKRKKG